MVSLENSELKNNDNSELDSPSIGFVSLGCPKAMVD